jgi:hypothetical protein
MDPVSDGNRISISRKMSPDQREVGSGKREVESRSEGSGVSVKGLELSQDGSGILTGQSSYCMKYLDIHYEIPAYVVQKFRSCTQFHIFTVNFVQINLYHGKNCNSS